MWEQAYIFLYDKVVFMYLENLDLSKKGQHPDSSCNSILNRGWLLGSVSMTIPTKLRTFDPKNLSLIQSSSPPPKT